jgi:glycosyltransferase involved in cell wall biosynthesis
MSVGGLGVEIDPKVANWRFPRDFANTLALRRLWLSQGLLDALMRESLVADVIHTHSLWTMPNVYPGWAAKAAGKPLVFSPHGTLGEAPLRISWQMKRAFWVIAQGAAVRNAACHHATCEAEYKAMRRFGITGPIAIIPIGIDLSLPSATENKHRRRLLFLSRIHPMKALPELLRAWGQVSPVYPDWELRIVGPDERGHRAELEKFSAELGLQAVTFAPPAYGESKTQEFAAADLFVLASHHENFGISVAEALAAGVPVVVSSEMPWTGVVTHGCGWQVQPNASSIALALGEAMSLSPEKLCAMGAAGRVWIAQDFSWQQIGTAFQALYEWITGGGPMPDTVRLT